jgi:PPOX class probable F420-dependent enzyme
VPLVFVVNDHTIYWTVDAKPKRSTDLKRVRNLRAHPYAEVLVDHYEEDWSALWWVRAAGAARIVSDQAEVARATSLLAAAYPQYRSTPPPGPVVAIEVEQLTWWAAADRGRGGSSPAR